MKIVDVVCSAGRTGFYFDDQRAIKGGAGHDGVFYVGAPVTEGFRAVRQAGESISVMLILEDGEVAYGDCAAVCPEQAIFLSKEYLITPTDRSQAVRNKETLYRLGGTKKGLVNKWNEHK